MGTKHPFLDREHEEGVSPLMGKGNVVVPEKWIMPDSSTSDLASPQDYKGVGLPLIVEDGAFSTFGLLAWAT